VLAYATAGVGIVGASAEASVPGLTFSDDDTETDFVYGLGLEGNISPGMSARIEYLGYADLDIDVIRAGLNFKLGR
jgi:opacity protein-like surface antigen